MTSTPLSGAELRDRVKALKLTYREAAEHLGLTLDGLNKQMSGARPVSRQTELLLGYVERALPARPSPRLRGRGGCRPRGRKDPSR